VIYSVEENPVGEGALIITVQMNLGRKIYKKITSAFLSKV
jgi:hypothetical protein